jgi:hypothetical protein
MPVVTQDSGETSSRQEVIYNDRVSFALVKWQQVTSVENRSPGRP